MKLSGGPTQDEVLAISLFKLELKRGDVLADVGCGTGKVSIEASKVCGKVYAIDIRGEAVAITNANVTSGSVQNIRVIHGNAKDVLSGIENLDAAFIGGSKDIDEVLHILKDKVSGNIVVNAVLLRTLNQTVKTMQDLGIFKEVVQVSISRSYHLADSIMFRPIDPVYLIVGRCC